MDMRTGSLFHKLKRFLCAISSILTFIMVVSGSYSFSNLPTGHLKPFGCCNPVKGGVVTVEGWPRPVTFFKDHVIPRKPVLFKKAAKVSPAYKFWTDEYFLNMDVPPDAQIKVEAGKKEDRDGSSEYMDFKDWVRQYNATNKYMVQDIPSYIGKDVVLPPCLQCTSFIDNIMVVENIMWFSSGGTKSVVHTDEFHNLNCLYAGSKHFILVDPSYRDKVPLDKGEGTFSSLDVERVDFEKYADLADVEYYNVTMEAGDCLFVPALWIHQVNSFNRNIAVNVWFRSDAGDNTDLSTCLDEFDPSITLDKVPRRGLVADEDIVGPIADMLFEWTEKGSKITFDEFHSAVFHDQSRYLSKEAGIGYTFPLKKMFQSIDKNSDGAITHEECNLAADEDWEDFAQGFHDLRVLLRFVFENRPDIYHGLFDSPSEATEVPSTDAAAESKGQEGYGKAGDFYFKEEL